MRFAIILAIAAAFASPLRAEVEPDFSGYVYELPAYYKEPKLLGSNGDYFLSNLTRIRLRPEINFSYDSRITAHYEIDLNWSERQVNPAMFPTGATNRQAVDLNWKVADDKKFFANHFIDLLYYKHIFDFGELTFGRQIVSQGSGRIWQPTDRFNPINPANFSKIERDGADAFAFKYYLGNFSDLEFVYNFREMWKDGNAAVRYRSKTGEYNYSIMSGFFDHRICAGADFAGNLFGAGVRGEALFSASKSDLNSNFTNAILGIDYQFTEELYALLEFNRNGEGASDKSDYDVLRAFKGEIQNVGRHYAASQINYKFNPLLNITATTMSNLDDGSGFVGGFLQYSAFDNLNLTAGSMVFYGDKYDEYWYYSTAYYLAVEFFF